MRKVIQIDEDKCDGCGLCVPSCAEGAIQVIDGKARLASETYCDGLGACLGECPQNAITIEEREAEAFSEIAVKKHLANSAITDSPKSKSMPSFNTIQPAHCPGSMSQSLRSINSKSSGAGAVDPEGEISHLTNWPVQIMLAPVKAPYFNNANLLIAADCVPFAFADFHRHFLKGRAVLIGCPKLDNMESYLDKLTKILAGNDIKAVEIAYMEVPCCFGLVLLIKMALENSGKEIPVILRKVGVRGSLHEEKANI
jgi:NAD-dependent dihydropyrimidine dehydrogenase PreA subunit